MFVIDIANAWHCVKSVRNRSYSGPSISPYSIRMRENTDQNNSEYGHFLRSMILPAILFYLEIYSKFSNKILINVPFNADILNFKQPLSYWLIWMVWGGMYQIY